MTKALLILVLAVGAMLPAPCDNAPATPAPVPAPSPVPTDAGFSPWLTSPAFKQWRIDNLKGKRFYCPTLEARFNNGVPEYRLKPVPVPAGFGCQAVTLRDMTEAGYQAKIVQFSNHPEFKQTCNFSIIDAQGIRHYQAVFVKLTPFGAGGSVNAQPGAGAQGPFSPANSDGL